MVVKATIDGKKGLYQYVMNSGPFTIFRRLKEDELDENQLKLFCSDCDCEDGCVKYKEGCTNGNCGC